MESTGVALDRTREGIERWLIARVAALAHIPAEDVRTDLPFAEFSLDSSVIITVTQELSRSLGQELSITLFWEFPTIAELTRALVEDVAVA